MVFDELKNLMMNSSMCMVFDENINHKILISHLIIYLINLSLVNNIN